MKEFGGKNMDFFYIIKYMATYIVIVAVFGVLLSHLYLSFSKQVRDEALDNGYKRLKEGISAVDTKIGDMYRYASLVRDDDGVGEMAKMHGLNESGDYWVLNKAREGVDDLFSVYDMRCSVIFKNNNMFVANGYSSVNYDEGYKTYASYENVTAKELKDMIFKTEKSISYLPVAKVKYKEAEDINALTCVVKMPVNSSLKYDCAVLFLLDEKEIVELALDEKMRESGFLYITDSDGNVLLNYNYNGDFEMPDTNDNYNIKTIDNEKYYIFSEKAIYSNLTAVAGISHKAFSDELRPVLSIVKLYIFFGVLLVIIACLFFSARQAAFVKGAINAFSGRRRSPGHIKSDYGYIQSEIKAISEENNRQNIEKMQEAIKSSLLEKVLMYGVYESGEKQQFEEYVGKHPEFFCMVCVHTDTDNYEEGLNLSECIKNRYEKEFDVLTICNGAKELNFIIWLDENESADIERILDFTNKLTKEFTLITACVSTVGSGIENIHTCYQQTKNMLRQIFDPSERFLCFKKHNDISFNRVFEGSMSKRLSEMVVIGEKEEIKKLFAKIKRNLRINVMENEQEIMQLFCEIKSPLDEIFTNMLKRSGEREIPQYKSQMPINDMIDELESFALYLCDCIFEKKRSKKEELRQKITEYMQNNYQNPGLCAAVVAEEFSLSEKYIFSVVKEYTGKTFNEFLEGIRLEKAQEYLLKTDMAVNKIAQMVGFNTIDTFYKAFKRVHGTAPGKWKENNTDKN